MELTTKQKEFAFSMVKEFFIQHPELVRSAENGQKFGSYLNANGLDGSSWKHFTAAYEALRDQLEYTPEHHAKVAQAARQATAQASADQAWRDFQKKLAEKGLQLSPDKSNMHLLLEATQAAYGNGVVTVDGLWATAGRIMRDLKWITPPSQMVRDELARTGFQKSPEEKSDKKLVRKWVEHQVNDGFTTGTKGRWEWVEVEAAPEEQAAAIPQKELERLRKEIANEIASYMCTRPGVPGRYDFSLIESRREALRKLASQFSDAREALAAVVRAKREFGETVKIVVGGTEQPQGKGWGKDGW